MNRSISLNAMALGRALAMALAAACGPASAAGVVTVNFVQPERFTDAGSSTREREANLRVLARHLQALGERSLPDGQQLDVEVLDVDLAGHLRHRAIGDVRILNGRTDWPRIELRYALKAGEQALRSGSESLYDMNYLHSLRSADEPLSHEKQLLDHWFTSALMSNPPRQP